MASKHKAPQTPEEMIEALYETEDPKEARTLAGRLLIVDPENPDALYALALLEEEADRSADLFERAVRELKKRSRGENPFMLDEEEGLPLPLVLRELAFAQLDGENWPGALATAAEFLASGVEDWVGYGRTLRQVALLLAGEYTPALEEAIAEGRENPVAAHIKAIVNLEMRDNPEETLRALWDAIRLAPDLPFFLLEYWEAPDEEEADDETLGCFETARLLQYAWTQTEQRMELFSSATTLFGYLTDRLPDEMVEEFEEESQLPEDVAEALESAREQIDAVYEKPDADMEEIDRIAIEHLSGIRLPSVQ